jgi:hypothetical protein
VLTLRPQRGVPAELLEDPALDELEACIEERAREASGCADERRMQQRLSQDLERSRLALAGLQPE